MYSMYERVDLYGMVGPCLIAQVAKSWLLALLGAEFSLISGTAHTVQVTGYTQGFFLSPLTFSMDETLTNLWQLWSTCYRLRASHCLSLKLVLSPCPVFWCSWWHRAPWHEKGWWVGTGTHYQLHYCWYRRRSWGKAVGFVSVADLWCSGLPGCPRLPSKWQCCPCLSSLFYQAYFWMNATLICMV